MPPLNALSTLVWDKTEHPEYELLLGADAFDEIDVKKYRKSVVVGALVPIIRKLMQENADFHILEKDSRTLKQRGNALLPSSGEGRRMRAGGGLIGDYRGNDFE